MQTAFLGVFFASALGMILFETGQAIRVITESTLDLDLKIHHFILEFTGSLIAIFFWVSLLRLQLVVTMINPQYTIYSYYMHPGYNIIPNVLHSFTLHTPKWSLHGCDCMPTFNLTAMQFKYYYCIINNIPVALPIISDSEMKCTMVQNPRCMLCCQYVKHTHQHPCDLTCQSMHACDNRRV